MKAFPIDSKYPENWGMDLRDYFAAKATDVDIKPFINDWENPVDAVYVSPNGDCIPSKKPSKRIREVAKYLYADAMMEARKAQEK